MYVEHPKLFLGIGLLFIPLGALIGLLAGLRPRWARSRWHRHDGGIGWRTGAARRRDRDHVDSGWAWHSSRLRRRRRWSRSTKDVRAGRFARTGSRSGEFWPFLGGLGFAVVVWIALNLTTVLIPVAIWIVVRWYILLAQVVELDDCSALDGLRRSSELVRGRWLRVAPSLGWALYSSSRPAR